MDNVAGRRVRQPAVAGMFYPARGSELAALVDTLLDAVPPAPTNVPPKLLVVPHAGYVYSGPIAAKAFAALRPWRQTIRRVVLLGPSHRVALRGLALPDCAAFATPLGEIPLDAEAAAALADLPQIVISETAHAFEHSLEVQLPFLQRVLDYFVLVPLVVGAASADEVATVIERLWGDCATLVLISSDLSHYHAYREAQRLDQATVASLLKLECLASHDQACGAAPLNGAVSLLRRKGISLALLDLRNSGDTCGSRDRVVGYAALSAFE